MSPIRHLKISVKKKLTYINILYILAFLILLLTSCSTTKTIPEQKYLLDRIQIKCDNIFIDKSDLESFVRQKTNRRMLIFFNAKFNLMVYNLASTSKPHKFTNWVKNTLGEEPIIWDEFQTKKTSEQLRLYLHSKGYYYSTVIDSVVFTGKKAVVTYIIKSQKPYRIKSIKYNFEDTLLTPFIIADTSASLLKTGTNFDVDILQNERDRISNLLKNNGFFGFSPDYLRFHADTLTEESKKGFNYWVDLTMIIKNPSSLPDINSTNIRHKLFKINKIYLYPNYNTKKALQEQEKYLNQFDTVLQKKGILLMYADKPIFKPEVLIQSIHLYKDSLYRLSNVEKTYRQLIALRLFKLINIQFAEGQNTDSTSKDNLLDCYIKLTPNTLQSFQFEVEGTNSSGNIGLAGNYAYQHKNIFKGIELFDLKLKGALETQSTVNQTGTAITNSNFLNTVEYAIETRLQLPQFLIPISSDNFIMEYNPRTNISLAYSYQRRPDFTRTIANFTFGYVWSGKDSPFIKHFLNPIDFNTIIVKNESADFINYISSLYITDSYKNQLISSSNYTFLYNTQDMKKLNVDHIFVRYFVESAGNLLSILDKLLNQQKNSGSYFMLGERYAQYFKSDIDVRYYFMLAKHNQNLKKPDQLVFRVFAGCGLPYGNSGEDMPFVKEYFSGGANSIRAWQVRALGPGGYSQALTGFPNQLGDIKLESNAEFRFNIFSQLDGALFVDAGNIWAWQQTTPGDNTNFALSSFYKQIAVGTGFGFRFDFSFFVLRFDFGLKLIDPSIDNLQQAWWSKGDLTNKDWTFNVGIGYPF